MYDKRDLVGKSQIYATITVNMATLKQLTVAKIISENPRKSVSSAMREAGYSHRSAEKPQELTRSKGWQVLMHDALPDEKLLQVHKGLLEHPDWHARDAGLEKAYKLKGTYQAEKLRFQDPLEKLSIEEIDQLIAENQAVFDRAKQFGKKKVVKQTVT